MQQIILWDLMDTLIQDPFFTLVPAFFGMTLDELLQQKHPRSWREFEIGKANEEHLFKHFFKDGREIDGPSLKQCMINGYQWIEGTVPLLRSLKSSGVEMHALSNYTPWYRDMDKRLGISRFIEMSFISCNTGVRKPAPEAYLGPARKLMKHPSELLFIDDRLENIGGATAVGMQAIHYEGNVDRLREQFIARHLL